MTWRSALLGGVLLVGCGGDRPPPGFESVAPPGSRSADSGCPDLVGSYVLSAEQAAQFLERPPPANAGHPVRLSMAQTGRSGNAIQPAYWAMDRSDFLAFAARFRQTNPDAYAQWRGLLLREQLSGPLLHNGDRWIDEVLRYGPLQAVSAGLVFHRCVDGWALAKSEMDRQWVQEQEVWLGRNREGFLLLKVVTYDLTSYHLWGDATSFLRSNPRYRWLKYPGTAAIDTAALSAVELPPVPVPENPGRDCDDPSARLSDANQFLLANLPGAAELISFAPQTEGLSSSDFRCRVIPVQVSLRLTRSSDFRQLEQVIDAHPGYRVEQLRIGPTSTLPVTVSFSLIVDRG